MTSPLSVLRRSLAAALAVLCLGPAPATAQDVGPALRAGHADLALFALSRSEPQISPLGEALLRLQGFRHAPGGPRFQRLSGGLVLLPTLRHDDNVNGGIPGRDLTLGPYRFRVAEESRSKAGMLYGLQAAGWQSLSYAPGARLRFQQSYLAEREPEHGYDHLAASARACAEEPVAGWTWADLCLAGLVDDDSRERDHSLVATLGLRRMLGTPLGSAQIGAQLGHLTAEDHEKPTARLDLALLTGHAGLFSAKLDLGARVEGENTLRRMVTLGWTGRVAGQDLSLSVARATSDGAQVFGIGRDDTIERATLTLHRKHLDIGLYAQSQRSSVDAFEDEDIGLSLTFRSDLLAKLRR